MKKLLNTLFVTTQGAYLAREGETVLVRADDEVRLRLPIHTLGGIVCFGKVSVSPWLMQLCGENNVLISFLSEAGKFMGRVCGPVSGNVLLRREQYRRADDPTASAKIARSIVCAKILNCRTVLQRARRDNPESSPEAVRLATDNLTRSVMSCDENQTLDQLRGREGDAAAVYFGVFDSLIVSQKQEFQFKNRSRRPPMDPINALLSFAYTLLAHDVTAALEGVGLDPAVGFLHRDRPGRPSLALDMMEELRPMLADRLVLSLVNRKQLQAGNFTVRENGAVQMDEAGRKEVLVAWQKRKQEEIIHPFINERIAIGLIPHVQALLLARHLRGDLDAYPAFFWK